MRTQRLGLIGTLLATGAIFMGCGSATKPVNEIEALKRARKAETGQSIQNFDKGMSAMSQKAIQDYANTAANNEAKDLKTIDAAEAERQRIRNLGNKLYKHMQGTTGGPKYNSNTDTNDSNLTLSATATGRLDGESEPVIGGEIEYRTNGTYFTFGATPETSTTESSGTDSLTRTWNSLDICVGKYKTSRNWTSKIGAGLDQESIETEGTVGITSINDIDIKNTPYVELGLEYTTRTGLRLGLDVEQTIVKDDNNDYSTTATAKIGWTF